MNRLPIRAGRTGDWIQMQGSCFASAGRVVGIALEKFKPIGNDRWEGWAQIAGFTGLSGQRQSTISPEAGPEQGKGLSTSQGVKQ